MLLVIFGAGASYDSDPLHPPQGSGFAHRPPMAAGLFSEVFGHIADQHEPCTILFPRLRQAGSGIEQELEKIVAQAQAYDIYNRALMSVRYYLKDVIELCQRDWINTYHPVTNYLNIVEKLYRWRVDRNEKISFVTFNYDTLLDIAYRRVFETQLSQISAFVGQESQRLFKVHGSTNWRRLITAPVSAIGSKLDLTDENIAISYMSPTMMTDRYASVEEILAANNPNLGFVPAIAIPTINKAGFECPPDHIGLLGTILSQVDRVLVVGWRGMEAHFLKLWNKSGTVRLAKILIVTGSPDGAKDTITNMRRDGGIQSAVPTRYATSGFTSFLHTPEGSDHLEWLLR